MFTKQHVIVYLAGPLFTQAEWQWNVRLAQKLREGSLDVILPQDESIPMLSGLKPFDADALFRVNVESIDRADVVVAIFDGVDVDSGTAWECGYAFKARRPVIGVRTDIRAGGDDPKATVNLMLSISCATIVSVPYGIRDDLDWVAAEILSAVQRVVREEKGSVLE